MKWLTASDARCDHLVRVNAEMHPSSGVGSRESVYAVFAEGCEAGGGQQASAAPSFSGAGFLGLVDGRQAMLFPQRIFADLLRPWQSGCVGPDTPLEEVQSKLLDELLYSLPIMDDAGNLLAAVTRDSVLQALVDREKQLFQVLKQGLDLQEQQHSLIAFEIHDGLIQCITAARMHLQLAAEHLDLEGVPARAAVQFARGMALLQEAIDEARSLIRGLHPPVLEGVGLVPAIESLVERQQASLEGQIEFVADAAPPRLSQFHEASIFRIVQEALTNAVRHSGATRIRVELAQRAEDVCIDVHDWGRGFDPQAPVAGFGLKGIRYRARALQGEADILSSPGAGTQITVRLPIAPLERVSVADEI